MTTTFSRTLIVALLLAVGLLMNGVGSAIVATQSVYVPAGSKVFEDGSFRTLDGRTGCLPKAPCAP